MSELKGFLRVKQIVKHLNIGRSTWWAWVKKGHAPEGIKFGDRVTAWKAEDIQNFIDKQAGEGGAK
jgi:predicted DNA-binding transcriptional regulator AlpA